VTETFADWIRETRHPDPPPPPKSCDCQFHIYGDVANYPSRPGTTYRAPDASFADARGMHRRLGFDRGVIVHPTSYGTDHRLLIDTLAGFGAADRSRYRATAIVDDTVSDAELERLNALGVCGARFIFAKFLNIVPTPEGFRRSIERIRALGWHARLCAMGDEWLELAPLFSGVRDITVVVDHLGCVNFAAGLDQPVVRWILDRLRHEGWWMMASNGNRFSTMEAGWDDAVPYGRAYIEAAPDRTIWGTDWPHIHWQKRMMNDAEEVELLYRYVDGDRDLLKRILCDNPARLHRFND
jgi:predicted TIM-barrel fold metal-dependent hydrolase